MSTLRFIITEDKQFLEQINKQDEFFINLLKPKKLDGTDINNIVYTSRKQFESLCVAIASSGISERPEKMTIMRFFTTLKFFEDKKVKQQSKQNKR